MNKLLTLPVAMLGFVLATSIACAERAGATSNPPRSPQQVATQAPTQPETVNSGNPGAIPVGQEMDVRLRTGLSSDSAKVEQRFETTTVVDLIQNGRVLVPAGSVVEGVVSGVDNATRTDRKGSLTLSFDRMRVNGRNHRIRASATEVFEAGGVRAEAPTAGVGAGVGGIVGGIIGGVKGAVIGAAIGAGGAIAATEGKDVNLPAGSIVRIRMDSPLQVG
ncbi:MAG TPA: hypothetical protein VGF24_25850 [Vicinamibacterales bacterium]|jgi:hypothetical protein